MPASQVDEQVVKMSFDNSNFDSNINDSIRTLNTLDRSLALFNSKESLNNINTSFNNLAHTFSIKGQIMFGVLNSLGKEIYGLGKRAFGSLTKGIKDGLGEYKTIIDSTEAIYQNVKQNGNSLQDVNNALDELNDYADKTIYNFGQMTRMIGMFSSAGVGLRESVSSIKGLSNAAALVGANMQKAQIGWNAVSRAMSSGKFTNMTWRSLELSGIAGKQFNKVITEVARNMHVKGKKTGKDIDGMIKKYGSLRESLQEGWLDKKVFTEAMDIMSGAMTKADLKKKGYTEKQIKELRAIALAAEEAATKVKTFQQLMDTISEAIGSGWAQSFRILLGDLEQAKKLYTRISNVISDFIDNNANIRNELFKQIVNGKDENVYGEWKTGRDNFRQIIENMLGIVKTFLKSVKTGFLNVFPIDRISAACRKVLGIFENFTRAISIANGEVTDSGEILWDTSSISMMSEAIKDLIKFFRGLASAADIAWMAISQPIQIIIKRIPFFNDFFKNTNTGLVGIIEKLGQFGDRITAFRETAKDWEIFGYITEYILDNIDQLGEKYPVLGLIVGVFKSLKNAASGIKNSFKQIGIKPLSAAFGLFKMVVTSLWKALNGLFGVIRGAARSVDWSWLEGPKNILKNILKVLSDYGRGLLDFEETSARIVGAITGTFNKVTNTFSKVSSGAGKIKTATYSMEKQFKNLNVTVDSTGKKVQSVWDKVKSFFDSIADFFKNMSNNSDMTFDGIAKRFALIGGGVAAAALSITSLTKAFGKLNIMNNINNLLTAGIDVIKAYQKEAQSKMILNVAVAIGILAVSMAALAFIPYDKLENGLTIFIAFMAVLSMTLPPIINAMAKFNESLGKTKKELTQFDVLDNLTKRLGKIGNRMATGFNARMIGKTFKDIAVAIFILVGAIAALVLLFKLDKDNTVKAIHAVAGMIGVMAVAVGVLTVAMNAFSKTASNFAGTFSQFAKLAGISGIIMSLSLAVLVLVGAMAILSKIEADRLETSFVVVASLIAFLSVIAITIAGITSNANNFNKLKKITVSISGAVIAVVAIAASFALLVKYINQDQTGSWWKALIVVGTIIVTFTGMVALLVKAANNIKDASVFKKLTQLSVVITGCILGIAGGLYLLSNANPIPASIVTTIGILTVATVSLIAFMAVVTAKAQGDFSTKFVKIIEGVAVAISAIVVSFGILTASVAALIAAISSVNISKSDADKTSASIVDKITYIAKTLKKALPELKKLFYSIGSSVGTVFTSFFTGFVNSVVEAGETYNNVAEKVVNLVIDILGKVIGTLRTRKDDISRIIKDFIDFLGTEVTAALNAFFSKDGEGIFKEEDVLKWIGAGGIATVLGKVVVPSILKTISNYNTLVTGFNNSKKNISGISKQFKKLKEDIQWNIELAKEYGEGWFSSFTKTSDSVKGLNSNAANTAASVGAIGVAAVGVAAAFTAVNGAWKRWTGEVQDSYKMEDLFSFKGLEQVLVDGFEKLGRIVIQFGLTLARGVVGALTGAIYLLMSILTKPVLWLSDLMIKVDPKNELWNNINKGTSDMLKGLEDTSSKSFGSIVTGWKNALDDTSDVGLDFFDKNLEKNLDAANKEAYNGAKEVTSNYKKGAEEGIEEMEDSLVKVQHAANMALIEGAKVDFDEHSPSKKSYGIYWNYILGAKNALSAGGKELCKQMEENNTRLAMTTLMGAKDLKEAYSKMGVGQIKVPEVHKYDVEYTDKDGNAKKVQLHEQLTEKIKEEAVALTGLSKIETQMFIAQKAASLGLSDYAEDVAEINAYLWAQQADQTSLAYDSVTKLQEATKVSWGEILSAEEEASMHAVEEQEKTNDLLLTATADIKKKIVGKKKEEAQEILKNELISRGIAEDQAEDEAHKMIALIMSRQDSQKEIELKALQDTVNIFKAERDAFEESQKEQTEILQRALAEREKATALAAKATNEMAKKANGEQSNWTVADYLDAMKKKMAADEEYNTAKTKLDQIVNAALKRLENNKMLNSKKFEDDYKKYYKQATTGNKDVGIAWQDYIKTALNKVPSAIDPTTWKMPPSNTGKGLKDPKNPKDPVKASKDLKKDLEKNRADLTPTIDLDRLSNEAKKANGIVTSSLMAAQNASIGDYINKDSELNPFMKDRWQNVYNFTQNNYSPKALSRIDIYRQTQRQLGMSRGF